MTNATDHLSPAVLLDLHEGRLDAAESERARAHLEECGACRSELALAVSFAEERGAADREVQEKHRALFASRFETETKEADSKRAESKVVPLSPSTSRTWLSRGLLAASVALVVFAGLQVSRDWRSGGGGTVRSVDPAIDWDVEVLRSGSDWTLTWTEVEGAENYRIQVLSALGAVLADVPGQSNGGTVSAEDLPRVAPERPLFVRVIAEGPTGTLRESRPRELPRP